MKTIVSTVLGMVVLSSSTALADGQGPVNGLTKSAANQSTSNRSSVRPEIKGAVIGAAIGAGTGLLINATLNDRERSASSYLATAFGPDY